VSDDGVDVVCLNCGSSSVKAARYLVRGDDARRVADAAVDGLTTTDDGAAVRDAATDVYRRLTDEHGPASVVGHRVVHGGPDLRAPVVVDDRVLDELHTVIPFAPLHLPAAIGAIEAVRALVPDVPQVACFDTAFHASLPESEWRLAIPRELSDLGIRRYGFHGLSYEYIVETVGAAVLGRAVVAHLGNGASLAAIDAGRSIATSMGMTPTGGIPMGTRTGDLDPGVIVHLVREQGYDADRLEELVDEQSGLLGIGGASDMRELLTRRERGDAAATLAIEIFCTRVAMQIAAYATVLGALDTLVFTAGIGEQAVAIRAEVGRRLAPLGVAIDETANAESAAVISSSRSGTVVRVVPTDEDWVIARHSARVISRTVLGPT
jgi:acetate kinase